MERIQQVEPQHQIYSGIVTMRCFAPKLRALVLSSSPPSPAFRDKNSGLCPVEGQGPLSPHDSCHESSLRDRHRFYIHELANAIGGELSAMAGLLNSAEGNARVRGDHLIDEDHARLKLIDEALALAVVGGPGAGA